MIESGIIYRGDVTITTADITKKRHNNCSSEMFRLLSAFLTGSVCPTSTLPSYLMMYNNHIDDVLANAERTGALTPVLNSYAPVYSYQEYDNTSGIYAAIFTSTFIANINGDPLDTQDNPHCIALLDGTQSRILASVVVDSDVVLKLSQKYQALIKWEITFRNGEVHVNEKDTQQ